MSANDDLACITLHLAAHAQKRMQILFHQAVCLTLNP